MDQRVLMLTVFELAIAACTFVHEMILWIFHCPTYSIFCAAQICLEILIRFMFLKKNLVLNCIHFLFAIIALTVAILELLHRSYRFQWFNVNVPPVVAAVILFVLVVEALIEYRRYVMKWVVRRLRF